MFWLVFVFTAIAVFLALMVYRVVAIVRMPLHLRWELAPVPHEKGKGKYGGSYFEEYEWWKKKRRTSLAGPVAYMAKEIFLLQSVWKNNRGFWPFSFALHTGIYLLIVTVFLHIVNALFIITGVTGTVLDVFRNIAAVAALAGDILGAIGAVGLILKRYLDPAFRNFTTFAAYFRLVFLGAIFISGAVAWFAVSAPMTEMSVFVKNLLTLNGGTAAVAPLAAHIIISALFIVYLPFTDMVHFVTKFFTYHAVRWNDAPQDSGMAEKLRGLAAQPLGWSADHITGGGEKNWEDLAVEDTGDREKH
ncbi:MAG: respiratory nitrate reductase subunit gamma [Dehalococcoidales bacterium]|jgi:nitrate reductase gamma subunit